MLGVVCKLVKFQPLVVSWKRMVVESAFILFGRLYLERVKHTKYLILIRNHVKPRIMIITAYSIRENV